MAMRGCVVVLAGVLTLVAGRGLEFLGPEEQYRVKGGRVPYDSHRVEPYPAYQRPNVPSRQLGLVAAQSNASAFENRPAVVPALQALPAPSNVTNEEARKIPNAGMPHKNFFERNPSLGNILDSASAPADETLKQQMVIEPELSSKLHRRKLRMRHRKGLKEHKPRKVDKFMEESGDLAALDSRRHPEAGRSEAAGRLDVSRLEPGHIDGNRLEALAGLKVEYARAYIAAEEPEADAGPMELLCTVGFREYATITWTVNGRPLENFIDRSTTTTVKNDIPVKVSKIVIDQLERLPSENGKFLFECTALVDAQMTKAAIALGSIIEDTCTSNAQCEARGAACSEGRCLCKPSQPVSLKSKHLTCRAAANLGWPCNYNEQCVFAQPNAVCTDRLVCDCTLGFVRSLDGKTCDKLTPTANLLGSPCKSNEDCHSAGATCVNGVCICGNDTMEKGGMCLPLGHLKLEARDFAAYQGAAVAINGSMPNPARVANAAPDTTAASTPMAATTGGAPCNAVRMSALLGGLLFALLR